MPLTEREDIEAVGSRPERVRVRQSEMHEAVTGSDVIRGLTRAVALNRDARPVEDEKISSSEPSRWSGVDHLSGSIRIRRTPTQSDASPVSDCQ